MASPLRISQNSMAQPLDTGQGSSTSSTDNPLPDDISVVSVSATQVNGDVGVFNSAQIIDLNAGDVRLTNLTITGELTLPTSFVLDALPPESITGSDSPGVGLLAPGAVHTYNLADGAVTPAKMSAGALTGVNLPTATLRDTRTSFYRTATADQVDGAGQPVGGFLPRNGATRVSDSAAADDVSIQAVPGGVPDGTAMMVGPYYGAPGHGPGLLPGHYRVVYYLKVNSTASTSQCAILRVSCPSAGYVSSVDVPIHPSDFATANQYYGFAVPLTVLQDMANSPGLDCEIIYYNTGTTVSFSHITGQPFDAVTPGEIVDNYIRSLNVSKLTAGTMTAAVVIGGSFSNTSASTGARFVLDNAGYRVYDSFNNVLVNLAASGSATFSGTVTGASIIGGTLTVPDSATLGTSSGGYLRVNERGMWAMLDATQNLILDPKPSGKTAALTYTTNATSAIKGVAVADKAGNVDIVNLYGRSTGLKVWATSGTTGNDYAKVNSILTLSPSTTYTLSFYTAGTNVNDSALSSATSVFANLANVAIVDKSASNLGTLASGMDGYEIVDTGGVGYSGPTVNQIATHSGTWSITGIWHAPRAIAIGSGFFYRWFKTFTTPSNLTAGAAVELRLPAPCGSTGTADTTHAIVYAGLQCETGPYMTRYCDGDQVDCTWLGTANASISNRGEVPGFIFQWNEDPIIKGRFKAKEVDVVTLKLGSGAPRGTNYASVSDNSGTQSLASGSTVTFNSVDTTRITADDGTIFDSNSHFVSQAPGMYNFSATVTVSSSGGTYRQLLWITQGGTYIANNSESFSAANTKVSASGQTYLPGNGYYITVRLYHDIGSNATLPVHSSTTPVSASFVQVA